MQGLGKASNHRVHLVISDQTSERRLDHGKELVILINNTLPYLSLQVENAVHYNSTKEK